jgi:hypothetical protein
MMCCTAASVVLAKPLAYPSQARACLLPIRVLGIALPDLDPYITRNQCTVLGSLLSTSRGTWACLCIKRDNLGHQ